ncbi:hypothetical protein [Microbacterium aurum]
MGNSYWPLTRMNHGIPEVKAPGWWGTDHQWRPATTSPTRLQHSILKA